MCHERLQAGPNLFGMLGAHVDLVRRIAETKLYGLLRLSIALFQIAEQQYLDLLCAIVYPLPVSD